MELSSGRPSSGRAARGGDCQPKTREIQRYSSRDALFLIVRAGVIGRLKNMTSIVNLGSDFAGSDATPEQPGTRACQVRHKNDRFGHPQERSGFQVRSRPIIISRNRCAEWTTKGYSRLRTTRFQSSSTKACPLLRLERLDLRPDKRFESLVDGTNLPEAADSLAACRDLRTHGFLFGPDQITSLGSDRFAQRPVGVVQKVAQSTIDGCKR